MADAGVCFLVFEDRLWLLLLADFGAVGILMVVAEDFEGGGGGVGDFRWAR